MKKLYLLVISFYFITASSSLTQSRVIHETVIYTGTPLGTIIGTVAGFYGGAQIANILLNLQHPPYDKYEKELNDMLLPNNLDALYRTDDYLYFQYRDTKEEKILDECFGCWYNERLEYHFPHNSFQGKVCEKFNTEKIIKLHKIMRRSVFDHWYHRKIAQTIFGVITAYFVGITIYTGHFSTRNFLLLS